MANIVERLLHQKEYWPPDDQALFVEAGAEIERLRAVILNIQGLAERGFPIDTAKLATRCRIALASE